MTPDEAYARKLRLTRQLERIDKANDNAAAAAHAAAAATEQKPEPGNLDYRWVGSRVLEVKIGGEWVPASVAAARTTGDIAECDKVLGEAGWF